MLKNPQRFLERILWGLIFLLTFEGLLRKVVSPGVGNVLFFAKDLLAVTLIIPLWMVSVPRASRWIARAWQLLAVAFLPLIALTAFNGVALASFGAKQYLLYPIVGIATTMAFASRTREELLAFARNAALLLIPTTVLAAIQFQLPPDHWLNSSVAGESLEAFSAGGRLRVASTFPFVAQFCMFLNIQVAFVAFGLAYGTRARVVFWYGLVGLLVLSTFATGSRGAVVVNGAILFGAIALMVYKAGMAGVVRLVLFLSIGSCIYLLLRSYKPEFFEAYDARVEGTVSSSHSREMADRIVGMFVNWGGEDTWIYSAVGHGLGIMSNGSDRLSSYAAKWRAGGFWTETDLANTYFEGGYYLVLVWMVFRGWIVFQCWRLFSTLRDKRAISAGAFCMAYVTVMGVGGTLGIQPPLACWWWICVGLLTALANIEYRAARLVQGGRSRQPDRAIAA